MHQDFIKHLASDKIVGDKIPIICNQENFILQGNFYKLRKACPDSYFIFNPAVKSSLDKGRPKGGMFISVPNSIKGQVSDVSPGHWRVQAAIMAAVEAKTLVINTYFPCETGRMVGQEVEECVEVIEVIRKVVRENEFDSLVICGDINTDFRRYSGQVEAVNDLLEELQLEKVWDRFNVDFTRVSCDNAGNVTNTSVIDHFFFSRKLFDQVIDAGTIHSVENRSDHSPVYCVLNSLNIELDISVPVRPPPKPSWKRASPEDKVVYRDNLDNLLRFIEIPNSVKSCRDVKCQDPNHYQDIDSFTVGVLEAVQVAADNSLPCPGAGLQGGRHDGHEGGHGGHGVPGWKEMVKPYRENAKFWHQVWVSCGKPINSAVHIVMKRTRNFYHYQFRKCQKAEENIKKNKLIEACLSNRGEDLFKEIKSLRSTKQLVANSIDGVKDNIPNHFMKIYSKLYNSVDDAENMAKVSSEVETKVDGLSLNEVEKVTPEIIKAATAKLKPGKSDSVYNFSSDCIKVDSELLAEYLSILIQSFLIHGHVSRFLLLATLVPIIKDKLGSMNTSKNYRSIAISSLVLKIFDWIIILLFGDSFGLHDLQFAYQPGISGNMCTYAILETVDYFLRNGSEVFLCTMDMTKAFDVTMHSLLFTKMMQAGLSAIFIRLLIFIYSEQFANVRWNNQFSAQFSMHNGVRQGAILSALAYCFYCEQLFSLLEQRRAGCWVKGHFLGLLGYSDDNVCLAPSLSALQEMIRTCEEFANSHNLKFSTDPNPQKCKTKTLAFLKKPRDLPNVYLCGNPLPWTDKFKHLGVTIGNKIDGCSLDMNIKNAQYVRKNIELNQEFHFSDPFTRLKLNNIYNSHYYGSCLWDLFSPGSVHLESSYNRSVKIMLDLPFATHRYLIQPLTEQEHVKILLVRRFLSFIEKIKKSAKPPLLMLLSDAMYDARSITGSNIRNIMLLVGKTSINGVCPADSNSIQYFEVKPEDIWRIPLAKELVEINSNNLEVPGFDEEELRRILNYICTE